MSTQARIVSAEAGTPDRLEFSGLKTSLLRFSGRYSGWRVSVPKNPTALTEAERKRDQEIKDTLARVYHTQWNPDGTQRLYRGQDILNHLRVSQTTIYEQELCHVLPTEEAGPIDMITLTRKTKLARGIQTGIEALRHIGFLSAYEYGGPLGLFMTMNDALVDKYCTSTLERGHNAQRQLDRLRTLMKKYGNLTGWELLNKMRHVERNPSRWWKKLVQSWFLKMSPEEILMDKKISTVEKESLQQGLNDLKTQGFLAAQQQKRSSERLVTTEFGKWCLTEGNPMNNMQEASAMILHLLEVLIAFWQAKQGGQEQKYAQIQEQLNDTKSKYQALEAQCQAEKDEAWSLILRADATQNTAKKERMEQQAEHHARLAEKLQDDLDIEALNVQQIPEDEIKLKRAYEATMEALREKIKALGTTHAMIRRLAFRDTLEEALRQLDALNDDALKDDTIERAIATQWHMIAKPVEEIQLEAAANAMYEKSLGKIIRQRLLDKIREEKTGNTTGTSSEITNTVAATDGPTLLERLLAGRPKDGQASKVQVAKAAG